MLAGHWELNVRSNNKMWTRLLVLLVLFIQSKFTKKTQHKQITIIQHRGLINYPAEPFFLWLDWQLCVLWHPPTRRLVWAANSLLCSVHLSFSPARPLMRLDAVCILCLQRSASSSRVWLEGRADKEVSRLTYQCSLPVCPSSCLYINPHLNLIRPFVLCTSVRI